MAVFGVDFGNLNCVVSTARKGGIDIITNEVSKRETGAMVSFGEKSRFLGEKAVDQQIRNWQNTAWCLKRLLGVQLDSEAGRHERKFVKNQLRADDKGLIEIKCRYKWDEHWFKPEQLIGALFTQLRKYAELESSTLVSDCVVSVPAYYTSTQRKLLAQSLQIAGLSPLTFINETTAAALDWGIFKSHTLPEDEKEAEVIAIVDVGHSATTCTIVAFNKGQLKVHGHVFDRCLGGRDFDFCLFEHFAAEVKKKYHCDLNEEKKNALKLLQAIDKFKKILSANPIAPLNCEMGEFDACFPDITRETLEELWKPLLVRLKDLCVSALKIPGSERITTVEVIGGGSRVPCVKNTIGEVFAKPLKTTLNASETVAKGCGIMAAMLSPKFKVREFSVVDANLYTVNLGYFSEKSQNPISDPNFPSINKKMVVLKPGDACPKTLNLTFDRSQDFELFVFYEPSPDVLDISSDLLIGKWRIGGIPSLGADQPSVKVRLRLSPSMSINVEGASVTEEWEEDEVVEEKKDEKKEAEKPKENGEASPSEPVPMDTDKTEADKKIVKKKKSKRHDCVVTVLASPGHPEARVTEMRGLEQSMIQSDHNVQETQEAKNNVESYIYDMRSKVSEGGQLFEYVNQKDRDSLLQRLTTTEDWLYGEGEDTAKDDYVVKLNEMKKLGNPIVNRHTSRLEIGPAVAAFLQKANEIRHQGLNQDGKLWYIPVEELQSVVAKADEVTLWITSETAKIEGTPKTQEIPITPAIIAAKQQELHDFANPILTKPKPKEEKKTEDSTKENPPKTPKEEKESSPPPAAQSETPGPTPSSPTSENKNKMDLD